MLVLVISLPSEIQISNYLCPVCEDSPQYHYVTILIIRYSCSVLRYALVTHIVQVTAHAVVTLYALHLQVTARRDITYETCGVP